MNTEEIINHLNLHKPEIISHFAANNWKHFKNYFFIKEGFLNNQINDQFEKVFCSFYILNGARGLNNEQKEVFFKTLKRNEINLELILRELYIIPGYQNSHKLFLSFASKLIHTVDNNLPIYDGNVSKVFGLSQCTYPNSIGEKINNRIEVYNELKERFRELLETSTIKDYLENIRNELMLKAGKDSFKWEDDYISDTKLLDSLLWALYLYI